MIDATANNTGRRRFVVVLTLGLALVLTSPAMGWEPPASDAPQASSVSTIFWIVGLLLAAVGIIPGLAVGYALSQQLLNRWHGPADSEAGKAARQRFGAAATVFVACMTSAGLAGAMVLTVLSVLVDGDLISSALTGFCFNVVLCILAPLVAWLVGQSGGI